MTNTPHRLTAKIDEKMLLALLIALLLSIVIIPLMESLPIGRVPMLVACTLVFALGVLTSIRQRAVFVPGIVVAVLATSTTWSSFFIDHAGVFVAGRCLATAALLLTAIIILGAVIRQHLATDHSVYGAICTYLLLGLAWAMLYSAVDRVDRNAFDIPHRRLMEASFAGQQVTAFSQMVFFSFVTMSTLGYGDITPTTQVAETLAWLQSVIGQFYLAVLVARLVSVLPSPIRREEAASEVSAGRGAARDPAG